MPFNQEKSSATKNNYSFAHAYEANEILALLDSNPHGLTISEAKTRLIQFGPNILPKEKPPGLMSVFFRQFLNPLIYVLLVAALISLLLKEWSDSAFIMAVLVINSIIGTLQEYHAQKSAEALQSMVSTQTRVLRNGESYVIDASELVPGDIVLVSGGEKVPADMRLLQTIGLEADESLLTGESTPVTKQADTKLSSETPLAERNNMIFAGSIISRGRGKGIVTLTGHSTEIGQLAQSLEIHEIAKPPLVHRIERFVVRITWILAVVIVVLATVKLLQGADWHEIFLVSVALAVSAIPEGLPVALTIALAIGMKRMAAKNVIIRRLVAVESLGSCTSIISDKTGTLTLNQLTVKHIVIPGKQSWETTGEGTDPKGLILYSGGTPENEDEAALVDLCLAAVLCNEAFLGKRDGQWIHYGDSVDIALLVMAHKTGITQSEALIHYPQLTSIPYESERGYAATLHTSNDKSFVFVKGALEHIIPMCSNMASTKHGDILNKELIVESSERLARDGFRVLAFASAELDYNPGHGFSEEHLQGLTLLGLVGMLDPLRVESKAAITSCRNAGIEVFMVTGDHPTTTLAIARELDLAESNEQIITGWEFADIAARGQQAVDHVTERTRVFARMAPSQKLDIVHSLERNGHYVAVTGDGANDAPAISASHVGVAMGRGTDVAKECADLIITDDNFSSIVKGIEEGRIAYQNIRKVIFLLISTGAAEIVLFTLSLITGLALPLSAVQLLWLNLVTNGIQDVALAFEPAEGDEMKRPPRKPNEAIFNRIMIERVVLSALAIGGAAFAVFHSLISTGMTTGEARNSTLLLMVLFENVHVFNCRSETRSAFVHNPLRNPMLLFSTLAAQLIHIGAMYTPMMQNILHIKPVSLDHWLHLLLAAITILFIMEFQKWLRSILATRQ